ncbi:hypothetical protein Godav_021280 [Gossypium davidsonii]|nr:hypothetical protein [Gossypium davidsonii]
MAIHNEEAPEMKNLATFLKWFYPLEHWVDMLMFDQAVQDTPAWKDLHEAGSSQKSNRKSKATLLPSFDDDVIPPDDLEKRIEQLELKSYRAHEEKRRKIEEFNITSDIDTDYDTEETESLS